MTGERRSQRPLTGHLLPLVPAPLPTPEHLASLTSELEWQRASLCAQADPERFFPERGDNTLAAKAVCRRCPVREECLDYALQNGEEWGVWGGLSERERRRLKRQVAA